MATTSCEESMNRVWIREVTLGRKRVIVTLECDTWVPPCEWKVGAALFGTRGYLRFTATLIRWNVVAQVGVFDREAA